MKSVADINLTPHSPQTMNAQNLRRLDQHMREFLTVHLGMRFFRVSGKHEYRLIQDIQYSCKQYPDNAAPYLL